MTNAEIILQNRVLLMDQGVLKGTMMKYEDADGEKEVLMPEEIHTFNAWKERGYQVQKGEHAVAKFPVWKYKATKQEAGDDVEPSKGKMFMKMAFFFTADQVKPIEMTEGK